MAAFMICCQLLAVLLISVSAVDPGFQFKVTQAGLQYAAGVATDVLSQKIKGQALPDQHGKSGKVKYDVTGMRVTSFGRPAIQIVVNPGKDVSLRLNGASIAVHGKWKYRLRVLFKITDHGSFDVSASGVDISASVSLGKSSGGRPTIHADSCSGRIGKVKIHLHGGASWFYKLFEHRIAKTLKHSLQKEICSALNKAVDDTAARALSTLPVIYTINNTFLLDFRLTEKPIFGNKYILTNHKGEIFWNGDKTEAPFKPSPLAKAPDTTHMVQAFISDYVINTFLHVVYKHNILHYVLTKKNLPAKQKNLLDTSCHTIQCIGNLIPGLKKFPNNSVDIAMRATSDPKLVIKDGDIQGHAVGVFDFNLHSNGSNLFTTNVSASVKLTVSFDGAKVTGKVLSIDPEIKVTHSNIGKVSSFALNLAFKGATVSIIPQLNDLMSKGLVIPSIKYVRFKNAKTTLLRDTLVVSTDLEYKPSAAEETNLMHIRDFEKTDVDGTLYFRPRDLKQNTEWVPVY